MDVKKEKAKHPDGWTKDSIALLLHALAERVRSNKVSGVHLEWDGGKELTLLEELKKP